MGVGHGVGDAVMGCALEGKQFEKVRPPPAHAVIYVYRPYTYGSSLLRPEVVCGEDMMRIGPGGYHAFIVPAWQEVTCSIHADSTDEVEIRTDARVYYIIEDLGWGRADGHPHPYTIHKHH